MRTWAWPLAGIAACILSWTYMHRVLLPWEHYVNVERGPVKRQMGDLYPRWVGTRELLLHGLNPYGNEVSCEIQIGFYGHPIVQSYDKPQFEIIDEQRFAYPIYVVFLLAPTVNSDFETLQRWAPVVLGALVVGAVALWLGVLSWRPPAWLALTLVLLFVSSPQIAQGLRLRQFGLFVAFLLALATWCAIRNWLFVAGVVLALATIKPQMVLLCLVWFLIWSLGDLKQRWRLVVGFAVALALLAAAGAILVPRWVAYFLEGLEAYRKYFPTTSPIRLIMGNWIGGILSIVVVLILLVYGWTHRKVTAQSPDFATVLSLFLIATVLVLPLLTPYNQVLLLLPVFILLRDWTTLPRWGRAGFSVLLAWPFVASMVLLMHPPQLNSLQRTPLLPSALALLVPFLVPVLIWVRSQRHA